MPIAKAWSVTETVLSKRWYKVGIQFMSLCLWLTDTAITNYTG